MNKRFLIRRLAIPAAIVAAASLIVLLALIPVDNARYESHKDEFRQYFNSFMDQNTKYLKGIASKITSLQPDAALLSELQAEYTADHQKSDQPKKYLWMTSMNGDFIFGLPTDDFRKLNAAFDKYQDIIKTDDFYRDRNDFLVKLIDRTDEIDFTQFERGQRGERRYHDNGWRFYEGRQDDGMLQSLTTSFVAPVYDASGKPIGRLLMKVDDRVNEAKYVGERRFDDDKFIDVVRKFAVVFLVFSGIFLWFLLPTWVYVDAQERDVKTPGVWAFLTLVSLIFGLTIYLITRPSTLKTFTCPQCKGNLDGARAYCPHCGHDLSNNFCPQCQYPINPEWKFCPDCRTEIHAQEKAPMPAQEEGMPETAGN